MYKLKILVVDDDPDILEVIKETLKDDFIIITTTTGNEALEKIKKELPELLILDYILPDISGIEVCKILRNDPFFIHLPILMLTGKGEINDKVKGLEAGVDDYMVKPFSPNELIARIKMLIRRSDINLDANPLTRLPGNVSITKKLEEKIKNNEKFALLYIDINNFKAINDCYGFERGDTVIKETAHLLINVLQQKGTQNDFIGHIGGDDFIIITKPRNAEEIAKKIINDFDKISPNFFDQDDRIKGYIETKSREGIVKKFNFLTIAIGIVTNLYRNFTHTAQISSLATELKSVAKKFSESKYVFDRRISE